MAKFVRLPTEYFKCDLTINIDYVKEIEVCEGRALSGWVVSICQIDSETGSTVVSKPFATIEEARLLRNIVLDLIEGKIG
jgi:hypothetical protein